MRVGRNTPNMIGNVTGVDPVVVESPVGRLVDPPAVYTAAVVDGDRVLLVYAETGYVAVGPVVYTAPDVGEF